MNPASITALISASQALLADSARSNDKIIPAFASSWIAWEALRTRFIRVVIHHKGWMLKDADAVLAKRKISSMGQAEDVINPWPEESSSLARAIGKVLETSL